DAALVAAVEMSDRYITGRCLPDKAIDVLDESGARIRLRSMTKPPNLAEIEEQIERLSIQKDEAVKNAEYEEAARLRDNAEALRKKKEEMQRQWREKAKEVDGVVDEEVIAEVVSKMTGVPLTRLEKEEAQRLLELENELHKRVVSQDDAIRAISKTIRRRPYSVVLLDEVEKAHPDVFNMLLQIMEEGHLTDSFGRRVDFRNVVMIMTSNIGADLIKGGVQPFGLQGRGKGSSKEDQSYEKM